MASSSLVENCSPTKKKGPQHPRRSDVDELSFAWEGAPALAQNLIQQLSMEQNLETKYAKGVEEENLKRMNQTPPRSLI